MNFEDAAIQFVVCLTIGLLVTQSARSRSMNYILWGTASAVVPVLALVFLLVRRPRLQPPQADSAMSGASVVAVTAASVLAAYVAYISPLSLGGLQVNTAITGVRTLGNGDTEYIPIPGSERGAKLEFRVVGGGEPMASDAALTGDDIEKVIVSGRRGLVEITLYFDSDGVEKFRRLTTEAVGHDLAIVLDGKTLSAPRIREPITGGVASISGAFSFREADKVAREITGLLDHDGSAAHEPS